MLAAALHAHLLNIASSMKSVWISVSVPGVGLRTDMQHLCGEIFVISNPIGSAARAVLATLVLVLSLGACATRVTQTGSYVAAGDQAGSAMPRPQRVLVTDFEVDPQAVQLDQGIGPRLMRTMQGGASTATPARQVQDAIAEAMVDDIRKMGIPVERGFPDAPSQPNDLVVQGQILRIDEGNRTRRLTVGFGAGKSTVEAKVQVYFNRGNGPPQLLQTYDADANSGRKPGMGVGVASAAAGGSLVPAAVSGTLGVHSEKKGVAGEGQHLGDRIAYNLGQFFVLQGWIPASSAPSLL
jgi:Domain of unknown function (DUF4410)